MTDKLILTHLCPITILSDNGTQYKNKIIQKVCKKLKIERIYNPYHSQHIVKLEGWYRRQHDSMRKMIQNDEATWDEVIPKILMA